jgi:hypothetical protein
MSIEESPESLRIVMPVERAGCVAIFLSAWLIGWLFGEISALTSLFRMHSLLNPGALFLLVWLAGWTVGGVVAAAVLAMTLDGREIVSFTAEEVDRRAEAFGRGLNWKYVMPEVTNLRPTGNDDGVKSFISFDHKGKTIRFGTGLNETEAERAVEAVWVRFPQLMPRVERVRREEAAVREPETAGYSEPGQGAADPEAASGEPPASPSGVDWA